MGEPFHHAVPDGGGLTLIFGVTRIVNFAMAASSRWARYGALHWLVNWFPAWAESAWLYAFAMLFREPCGSNYGAIAEFCLLRRLYGVPELYQLAATLVESALHDGMLAAFGSQEVFAPRFPDFRAIAVGDDFFPRPPGRHHRAGALVVAGLAPAADLVTLWHPGARATPGPRHARRVGVNPAPLMLGHRTGCVLAGLVALQLPREPAHLQMDVNMVVETLSWWSLAAWAALARLAAL